MAAIVSKKIFFSTSSDKETTALGQKIGFNLFPGAVLALNGDLGSGKTTFVKGLAQGLGVPQDYYITSPTFTLINEYPGRCRLYHVDLFRLENAVDFDEIGLADIIAGDGVVAIEWAQRLTEGFLAEYIAANFIIADDDLRKICLQAYGHKEADLLSCFEKLRTREKKLR